MKTAVVTLVQSKELWHTMSGNQFSIGDVVVDSHDTDGDFAVVIHQPSKKADRWIAYSDTTVAEDNLEYPNDSQLVVVAFYDDLVDQAEELLWPDESVPINELNGHGVKDYAFPVDRVELVENPELDGSTTESQEGTEGEQADEGDSSDLEQSEGQSVGEDDEMDEDEDDSITQHLEEFQAYLKDNGVRSEIDGESVVVSKLGQTYRLVPGEVIEGDGPFRDRLEGLAADAPQ